MAFYNFGLRFLRRVHDADKAGSRFMSIEHCTPSDAVGVRRTGEFLRAG